MDNKHFEVGQTVIIIRGFDGRIGKGDKGVIVCFHQNKSYIGIEFDRFIYGHNCYGACDDGYGYFVPAGMLKKVLFDISHEIGSALNEIYNLR